MKKILTTLGLLALLTPALMAEQSDDSIYQKETVIIDMATGTTFLYDRKTLSVRDQNPSKMERNLNKTICQDPSLRKMVVKESLLLFIYLYKDGTITASVTDCY